VIGVSLRMETTFKRFLPARLSTNLLKFTFSPTLVSERIISKPSLETACNLRLNDSFVDRSCNAFHITYGKHCNCLLTGSLSLSRYSDFVCVGRSRDRNLVGARFSAPVQTVPGAHPISYTVGFGCLTRG
jgi:hypothetical protein